MLNILLLAYINNKVFFFLLEAATLIKDNYKELFCSLCHYCFVISKLHSLFPRVDFMHLMKQKV